MISTIVFLMFGPAHAQSPLKFTPDPTFAGHYEGVCLHPIDGIAIETPVTLTLNETGVILSHPMPNKIALDGSLVPGRVWSVHYPVALLSSRMAPGCLAVQSSPASPRQIATVCFEHNETSGLRTVEVRALGDALMCRQVTLVRTSYQSDVAATNPYGELYRKEFDLAVTLRRMQDSARPLRQARRAEAGGFDVNAAALKFFRDRQSHTYQPQSVRRQVVEDAGRGFLKASHVEMIERWAILGAALEDQDPGIREAAFHQIALRVHAPIALNPILTQLHNPGDHDVLRAALDAADGIFEPLNEFIAHTERLVRRFWTTDLSHVFEMSRGLIDAADLAAIVAHETYALPGGLRWNETNRNHLIEALAELAERYGVPDDLRKRAAQIVLNNAVKTDHVEHHLAMLTHSPYASRDLRRAANFFMRKINYERHNVENHLAAAARNRNLDREMRRGLRSALKARKGPGPDLVHVRCAQVLSEP